jgi:hypothetical protein
VEHHYHFDIFNATIDFQLQELDSSFTIWNMSGRAGSPIRIGALGMPFFGGRPDEQYTPFGQELTLGSDFSFFLFGVTK